MTSEVRSAWEYDLIGCVRTKQILTGRRAAGPAPCSRETHRREGSRLSAKASVRLRRHRERSPRKPPVTSVRRAPGTSTHDASAPLPPMGWPCLGSRRCCRCAMPRLACRCLRPGAFEGGTGPGGPGQRQSQASAGVRTIETLSIARAVPLGGHTRSVAPTGTCGALRAELRSTKPSASAGQKCLDDLDDEPVILQLRKAGDRNAADATTPADENGKRTSVCCEPGWIEPGVLVE